MSSLSDFLHKDIKQALIFIHFMIFTLPLLLAQLTQFEAFKNLLYIMGASIRCVIYDCAKVGRLHLYEGIISATAAAAVLLQLLFYCCCHNCTAAAATVLLLLSLVYQNELWQPLYENNNLSVTSQLVWSVVTTNCHGLSPSK